jgi:uncharacterized repeat protein (TIGR01451 family)
LGSGGATAIVSNSVDVIVVPPPSRAALTLMRADLGGSMSVASATQCVSGATLTPLPPPHGSNGQPFALGQPLPLGATAVVHGGEAVFLELVDADRNRDAAVLDSVELVVTAAGGDRESIVLAETAPDSGRFAGYVQTRAAPAVTGNCVLEVQRDTELTARYSDPLDSSDTATAAALVDPFGLVFDSQTGAPVNGARVRLVAAGSGAPAAVRGDDGVSAYPAELVTGQAVTDSGGTVYTFAPGVFRFPLLAAGDYRLVVDPPERFAAPSTVPEARLQTLPGAPYTLQPASFGAAFTVHGELAQAVDIPLDPTGSVLFVSKRAALDVAAVGDFVPYSVTVRNAGDAAALTNVVVTDRLPPGMRYRPGSARFDSGSAAEPEVGNDGSTLTFLLPQLEAGRSVTLRYVTVVAAGATGSTLVNRVAAQADGAVESNSASAAVLLREELFSSAALLLGRVVAGTCDTTVETGAGVAGVRVYLEDGRYAVTDDEGKYHFEGLTPGSHVVQLDTITLPEQLEPLRGDTRVRSAGSATAQCVDLRGGARGTPHNGGAQRAAPRGDFLARCERHPAHPIAARENRNDCRVGADHDARRPRLLGQRIDQRARPVGQDHPRPERARPAQSRSARPPSAMRGCRSRRQRRRPGSSTRLSSWRAPCRSLLRSCSCCCPTVLRTCRAAPRATAHGRRIPRCRAARCAFASATLRPTSRRTSRSRRAEPTMPAAIRPCRHCCVSRRRSAAPSARHRLPTSYIAKNRSSSA